MVDGGRRFLVGGWWFAVGGWWLVVVAVVSVVVLVRQLQCSTRSSVYLSCGGGWWLVRGQVVSGMGFERYCVVSLQRGR